jgi:para-nitrobenzyl esterase
MSFISRFPCTNLRIRIVHQFATLRQLKQEVAMFAIRLLAAVGVLSMCTMAFAAAAKIQTHSGVIEGTTEGDLRIFKGIPFAQPPVGELRWKEPQPVAKWQGVRETTRFAARCMQRPLFSDMMFRSNGISEDCLYLNVWTPAKSAHDKLPVLVYFYGGGFQAGDGSEYRYDGAHMAEKGIVAITVNYRLDVFGMLAHPELTQESAHHSSGNYALLDQSAALHWVHDNIAAFGGDPRKITIAGESAGSSSVSAQMASPLSRNLIAGAIGESGSMLRVTTSLSEAEQAGVKYASMLGANSIAALRAMPADQLLQAAANDSLPKLGMIVDGYFFPKAPLAIFQSGEQAHVPLLAGTNSQESAADGILGQQPMTVTNYRAALRALYADRADEVFGLYPARSDAEVADAARELASDRFLALSTWKWVDVHARTSKKPTFYYYYAHPRPVTRADLNAPKPTGAVHSAEIEYVMGNLRTNPVFAWTDDDRKVSQIMQAYFANFVRTGNPNGKGLVRWNAYNSSDSHPRLTIDVEPQLLPDTRRTRYQAMDKLPNDSED